MDSTGEGEGAILQLKRENARLRELYGRRSREIELKMGELRSALHQANEKYKELESVVGASRSLVSDLGLGGEEPEEGSGAQGTSAGRERASPSAGETTKRPSENFEEEPPREMGPLPARASEEEDVSLTDADGMSPLHRAAVEGDVRRVRELIARGADPRLHDRWGMTPLHCALWAGREGAADLLTEMDRGNDVQDAEGRTPFHWAALRGHVGALSKLLAGGAGTRIQDRWGRTPLHAALDRGTEAAAELIAEADGGIELRDERGRTPLHQAAERGFARIVATLLHNDVNPHPRDDEGNYPLHLALRGGRRDDVPKRILSSCALKDISMDWEELGLAPDDLRFCVGVMSLCSEEVRLMKDARVGASSVSYHDLVTRHVSRAAPRLPSGSMRSVVGPASFRRAFPHYAHLISRRLRSALERREPMDRCRRSFSRLPPELLPLPVTYTDVILSCLSNRDMENFSRAVQFPSRE